MGGQMDRGNKDSFQRAADVGQALIDDPKAREQALNNAKEVGKTALDAGLDVLERGVGAATDQLEKLTREQLTPDQIDKIVKEGGTDALTTAIKGAGYATLFGGTAAMATTIADMYAKSNPDNFATLIYNKINGITPETGTPGATSNLSFLERIQTEGIGAVVGDWVNSLKDMLNPIKMLSGLIEKFTGVKVDPYINQAESMIAMAETEVANGLGGMSADNNQRVRGNPSPETSREPFETARQGAPPAQEAPEQTLATTPVPQTQGPRVT